MPRHKRGPWSQQEDQFVLSLVNSQGPSNWVHISEIIGTRSPKQCRERYHQNLKPTLNHAPITPAEGIIIESLVKQMGKRWAEIARRLNGRSDNAVKNWWNGGMNRRRRMESRRGNSASFQAEAPRNRNEHGHLPPRAQEHAPRSEGLESRYPDPAHGQRHPPGQHHPHGQHHPPGQYHPRGQHHPFRPRHPLDFGTILPRPGSLRRSVEAPLPSPSFSFSQSLGRYAEGPLPSPSALSFNSHAESNGPPSLISDARSSHTPPPPPHYRPSDLSTRELPPLCASRVDRRSSTPFLHICDQCGVAHDPLAGFRQDDGKPSHVAPLSGIGQPLGRGLPPPQYHHTTRDAARPPPGQLPLPAFSSLAAPTLQPQARPRSQTPNSDTTRDPRMSLSNMLS